MNLRRLTTRTLAIAAGTRALAAGTSAFAAGLVAFGPQAIATPLAESRAFVYTTDFATGSLTEIAFGPPRTVDADVRSLCSDAVLRHHQGLLYVIERACNNIHVLDPGNSYATVRQFSVGDGANPHDIEVVEPTRAFVTRYEKTDLWIVNPQTGSQTGGVSLADLADADGIPEMDHLALANGRVFVSVQRIDRDGGFVPTDSSQIVVIDATNGELVDVDPAAPGNQGILLPFQNPFTEMVVDAAGQIVLGCSGSFGALDGGIVRVDPIRLTATVEATESALGGDVNDVVPFTGARGFAVVSGSFPESPTTVVAYDRASGTNLGPVYGTPGFSLADAEVNDRGELWVCDRTFANPGVRVFDAASGMQLTVDPLATGLPPQDLTFDGTRLVGIPEPGQSGGSPAVVVAPNPSRDVALIRVRMASRSGDRSANASIAIHDLRGRQIRTLEPAAGADGILNAVWDGRDEQGRDVASGFYLVRATRGGEQISGRLLRFP